MALPFGSRMVPIARDPSSFLTFVATRTNSSPLLTKIVAVPPTSFCTSSTSTKLLFILVAKMQGGDNLAGDCLLPFDVGRTQRRSLRLEKLHRSLHILSRSGEHSCGKLNQKICSKVKQHQCEHGLLPGYL